MAAQVIPFDFESREVRTLLIDDQPWFVAADVSRALNYLAAKDMTRNLDDDEKGRQIVPTPSGNQEMLVINESGLFSAVLRSRKPEAKRFKKWVTAEVLPSIRKHGHYNDDQGKMDTLLGQTIGANGFNILGGIIKGKVAPLEYSVRRSATAKLWSQVHAAFGVRSAEDIPADQFDSARQFIASYAIEGEYLPAAEKPLDDNFTANAEAVLMFNRVACHRWRELDQLTERHTELMKKQQQLLEEQEEINQKLRKLSVDLYDPIFEPGHRLHILTCGVQMDHSKVKQFITMQDKARRY